MKLETFITNSLREKSYILYDENTKEAICIDPGNRDEGLLEFINENRLLLKYVLLTHGHFDHIQGVKYLRPTGMKVVAYEDEKEILENPEINGGQFYNIKAEVKADIFANEQTRLEDISFDVKILHTPGHTQGGCCYYVPSCNLIFTGDTLFRETIGRSDLHSGNFEKLIESIKEKLFVLDEEVVCLPGHGENTTIAHERHHNQFFR